MFLRIVRNAGETVSLSLVTSKDVILKEWSSAIIEKVLFVGIREVLDTIIEKAGE